MVGSEGGRDRVERRVGGSEELVLSLLLFAPEGMSKDPKAHT